MNSSYSCTLLVLCLLQIINAQNLTDAEIEAKYKCKCVAYYQCDENNLIIKDGKGLIDVRFGESENVLCNALTSRCCKLEVTSTATNQTEPLNPTVREPKFLSCGQPRTRLETNEISSNEPSTSTIKGEIPWIVEIFEKGSYPAPKFKCAGSIIHPRVVLTATHCVKSAKANDLILIASGKEVFQEVEESQNSEKRGVVKLIKHEHYYSGVLENDIALLILDKSFDFSKAYINSVCLPTSDDNFVGERCIVMGWGRTSTSKQSDSRLKKIDLPVVERSNCEEKLRRTRLGKHFELHPSFLCAGGEEGKDACRGDGGGPLVCRRKDKSYVVIGVVSWGVDCGVQDVPGIYANVTHFVEWIDQKFKENIDEIEKM